MNEWELEHLNVSSHDPAEAVRQLTATAREGWEPIFALPMTTDPHTVTVILKRPRRPAVEKCEATTVEYVGDPPVFCVLVGHHAEHEAARLDGTTLRWRTDAEGKPMRSSKRIGRG